MMIGCTGEEMNGIMFASVVRSISIRDVIKNLLNVYMKEL